VEEGIVIGGGCTFLKLAQKVDAIKETLDNDEQKVRVKLPTSRKCYRDEGLPGGCQISAQLTDTDPITSLSRVFWNTANMGRDICDRASAL
jgi:hypothetical protein